MKKEKHLSMIQEVVGRFSKYSFTIKSWNITLLTAFIAYSIKEEIDSCIAIIIALAFTIGFMILDGYYLNLEKSYRNLYKGVREITKDDDVDFRMAFHKKEDQPKNYIIVLDKWYYGFTRPIIWAFYLMESIILVLLLIFG